MIKNIRLIHPICFVAVAAIFSASLAGCNKEPANKVETPAVQPAPVITATPSDQVKNTDKKHAPRISKNCTRADKNEDGQTSEEEAAAHFKEKLEENREKLNGHNLVMMQKYDANHDGRLEKNELGEYFKYRKEIMTPSNQ